MSTAGGDGMGGIIILILVILFFLWLSNGGPMNKNVDKPFIKITNPQIQSTSTTTTTTTTNQ